MQIHLHRLLLSKEGADITFEVMGGRFAAHRCVLASRSSVFKEQLFGGTMTNKDIVEIHDIQAQVFNDLLVYIYTDSFNFEWTYWNNTDWIEDEGDQSQSGDEEEESLGEEDAYVTWLLQLLEAADRYDLQRLKLICAEHLVECIHVDNVGDIIVAAEWGQCRWLKDSCVEFIKRNSSLYTVMTADSLDKIIRTCSPFVVKELLSTFAT
jgi:speckle-type POZ protein